MYQSIASKLHVKGAGRWFPVVSLSDRVELLLFYLKGLSLVYSIK